MLSLLTLFTCLILIATLLPISNNTHWLIRGLDFPRLQVAILAVLLIFADLFLLDLNQPFSLLLIATSIFCVAWQLWWILPYTVLWSKEVKKANANGSQPRLRILTSNVLTSNRNSQALISLVKTHKPDILVTLESDQWWENQLDVLSKDMPHAIKCPLDNLYGMHVYSRLPLSEAETCFLVEDDVPSMHASIMLSDGTSVRAHFLHPSPPSPTENEESKERDAELIVVAKSIDDYTKPIVVTGDLNDVAWSATTRLFRKISGLLDPRIGRGMFNTFHAGYPLIRWPLDHLFHSDHFTVKDIQRLPSIGSDHFPLLTTLIFAPQNKPLNDGIDATREDYTQAEKIISKESVKVSDIPNPGA